MADRRVIVIGGTFRQAVDWARGLGLATREWTWASHPATIRIPPTGGVLFRVLPDASPALVELAERYVSESRAAWWTDQP
jgi:hypothetical protein